jgi:hypothetical protein
MRRNYITDEPEDLLGPVNRWLAILLIASLLFAVSSCGSTRHSDKAIAHSDSTSTVSKSSTQDISTAVSEAKARQWADSATASNTTDTQDTTVTFPVLIPVDSSDQSADQGLPTVHQGGKTFKVFTAKKDISHTHAEAKTQTTSKGSDVGQFTAQITETRHIDSIGNTEVVKSSKNKKVDKKETHVPVWLWILLIIVIVYTIYRFRYSIIEMWTKL